MYWTSTGTAPRIEKASMDGTLRTVLHDVNLTSPYGITMDTETQTLYWSDITHNVLEKSNTDGTDRVILTRNMILDPYFLAYYDGNLYWGDWAYNRLLTLSVSSPNDVRFFNTRYYNDIYGVQVISPYNQRQG